MNEHEHEDVYQQCRIDTSNRLTKIETILAQQTEILAKILTQTSQTNGRVTKLEMWRGKMLGINIGVSMIVSSLIAIAGILISIFLK